MMQYEGSMVLPALQAYFIEKLKDNLETLKKKYTSKRRIMSLSKQSVTHFLYYIIFKSLPTSFFQQRIADQSIICWIAPSGLN